MIAFSFIGLLQGNNTMRIVTTNHTAPKGAWLKTTPKGDRRFASYRRQRFLVLQCHVQILSSVVFTMTNNNLYVLKFYRVNSYVPLFYTSSLTAVAGGDVFYYHFTEMQLDRLVPGTPGPFIACDVSPLSYATNSIQNLKNSTSPMVRKFLNTYELSQTPYPAVNCTRGGPIIRIQNPQAHL
jgi:hypothetical protein